MDHSVRGWLLASSALVFVASGPALAQQQDCTQRLDQIEQQLAQAQLDQQRQEEVQEVIKGARALADTGDQEGCMQVVAELEDLTQFLEQQGGQQQAQTGGQQQQQQGGGQGLPQVQQSVQRAEQALQHNPKPWNYVCNRTKMSVVMAVAAWERRSNEDDPVIFGIGFATGVSGWFVLRPDECKPIEDASNKVPEGEVRPYLIHAFTRVFGETRQQYRWTGHSEYPRDVDAGKSVPGCVHDGIMRLEWTCAGVAAEQRAGKTGYRVVHFKQLFSHGNDKPLELTVENADPFTDEPDLEVMSFDQALSAPVEESPSPPIRSDPSFVNPNFAKDLVQDRCIIVWDDPPQPRSVEALRLTIKWKKLRHCIRLRAYGPVEVSGLAREFVNACIKKGVDDPKVEGAVKTLIGLGVDILSAGATSGSATAAALLDYLDNVREATMSCLTSGEELEALVKDELKDQFAATISNETYWLDM